MIMTCFCYVLINVNWKLKKNKQNQSRVKSLFYSYYHLVCRNYEGDNISISLNSTLFINFLLFW